MSVVAPPTERSFEITNFVDELVICMMNARVYPSAHARVVGSMQEILRMLQAFAKQRGLGAVTLGTVDGCLVHDERPLIGASLSAKRLIDSIVARGAGAIQIDHDATAEDITALMQALLTPIKEVTTHEEANKKLLAGGCRAARFLPPFSSLGATGSGPGPSPGPGTGASALVADATAKATGTASNEEPIRLPVHLYQATADLMQSLTIAVCQGSTFGFEIAQGSVEGILKHLRRDAKSLLGMARYEQYDSYTFGHSIRVCLLALNFARALTDDEGLLNRIGVAALLHDIGKARVPFEVLHCKTRLDVEQKRAMEQHPALGAAILLENGGADPMSVAAAFGHHMVPGAGGYPRVVQQGQLSLVTRIVKICDVFEALTAVRPYKDSMSPTRAFRIMLSMKQSFDAALLRRFIEVTGVYPIGSVVELDDGSRARVERQGARLDQPVVRLETTPTGHLLCSGDQVLVDLAQARGADGVRTVRAMLSQTALQGVG